MAKHRDLFVFRDSLNVERNAFLAEKANVQADLRSNKENVMLALELGEELSGRIRAVATTKLAGGAEPYHEAARFRKP